MILCLIVIAIILIITVIIIIILFIIINLSPQKRDPSKGVRPSNHVEVTCSVTLKSLEFAALFATFEEGLRKTSSVRQVCTVGPKMEAARAAAERGYNII